MSFEKKKIQLETLGEYLSEVRKQLGFSVQEVADKIQVKFKFLESLEQGKLNQLPPDVYVIGFLRQLAALYASDPEILIAQYKKEKNIEKLMHPTSSKTWKSRYLNKLVITPKLLTIALGVMFVLLTLSYVVWQVLSINKTPTLEISQPQDGQAVNGSAVTIIGKTLAGTNVTINGNDIFVDGKGNFKTQLSITSGVNNLDINASNKFGKNVDKQLSIIGQAPFVTNNSQLNLQLVFSGEVTLEVTLDDQPSQTVSFHSGDNKTFMAKNKIVISTSNAGTTKAILNGQSLGILGRAGEKLINVQFLAQSGSIKAK